jgi:hypothetical protein
MDLGGRDLRVAEIVPVLLTWLVLPQSPHWNLAYSNNLTSCHSDLTTPSGPKQCRLLIIVLRGYVHQPLATVRPLRDDDTTRLATSDVSCISTSLSVSNASCPFGKPITLSS